MQSVAFIQSDSQSWPMTMRKPCALGQYRVCKPDFLLLQPTGKVLIYVPLDSITHTPLNMAGNEMKWPCCCVRLPGFTAKLKLLVGSSHLFSTQETKSRLEQLCSRRRLIVSSSWTKLPRAIRVNSTAGQHRNVAMSTTIPSSNDVCRIHCASQEVSSSVSSPTLFSRAFWPRESS